MWNGRLPPRWLYCFGGDVTNAPQWCWTTYTTTILHSTLHLLGQNTKLSEDWIPRYIMLLCPSCAFQALSQPHSTTEWESIHDFLTRSLQSVRTRWVLPIGPDARDARLTLVCVTGRVYSSIVARRWQAYVSTVSLALLDHKKQLGRRKLLKEAYEKEMRKTIWQSYSACCIYK